MTYLEIQMQANRTKFCKLCCIAFAGVLVVKLARITKAHTQSFGKAELLHGWAHMDRVWAIKLGKLPITQRVFTKLLL
jgi:hypothetical protein